MLPSLSRLIPSQLYIAVSCSAPEAGVVLIRCVILATVWQPHRVIHYRLQSKHCGRYGWFVYKYWSPLRIMQQTSTPTTPLHCLAILFLCHLRLTCSCRSSHCSFLLSFQLVSANCPFGVLTSHRTAVCAQSCERTYAVQSGDTCNSICADQDVSTCVAHWS